MRQWQKNVLLAHTKGVRATVRGQIIGVRGRPLFLCKSKYPTFHVRAKGKEIRVVAHKFAAYCFFGERALRTPCVRHRNGDRRDLRKANLAPGTYSENERDKPIAVRVRSARIAARSTRRYRRAHRRRSRCRSAQES